MLRKPKRKKTARNAHQITAPNSLLSRCPTFGSVMEQAMKIYS